MGKKKKGLQMQRRTVIRQDYERERALLKKYPPPAQRDVMIDASGTEDEFNARIFHAWVNGRDIPVEDLCILFHTDETTIRRWMAMKD